MKMDICMMMEKMKLMKSNNGILISHSNTIYGVDDFSVLKCIRNVPVNYFDRNVSFHNRIDLNKSYLNYEIKEFEYGFVVEGTPLKKKIEPKMNLYREPREDYLVMIDMINNASLAIMNEPIKVIPELRGNALFEEIINMKASQGNKYFPLMEYGLPFGIYIHSSLLPINKKDSVSLNIYNWDEQTFLARFIIKKSKTEEIEVMIRCLKI